MRIIDCWCFQWKRHWICYKLLLNLLQVGVHVNKIVASHSWPCYICFKWSCWIMFLSLKFVVLNVCWFKKCSLFVCVCVVHAVVVDHEIPDEGMSHVLWKCHIIHVRNFVAFLIVITFITGYVVAIYVWVVKLPKVLFRHLMMYVLFGEGSCGGWKASDC